MSKIWRIVCIAIVCGLVLWGAAEVYYCNSYKGARVVGDWKRIPLWYPYELIDFGGAQGITVWDCTKSEQGGVYDESMDRRTFVKQTWFDNIIEFDIANDCIFGRRRIVRPLPFEDYGYAFFLFEKGKKPVYFDDEESFHSMCRKRELKWDSMRDDFDEYYDFYWSKHGLGTQVMLLFRGGNLDTVEGKK